MKKILLIEDERIIAEDIRINLEKDRFARVSIAANYRDAKKQFATFVPDLIISDVQLNEVKDGIEIITELLAEKRLPVIYLTAYSDDETIARIESTFPSAYLLKPYNISQLKTSINLAFNNFVDQTISTTGKNEQNGKLDLLTSREREILSKLAAGKMSKEIALNLKISVHTVEQHKKNIRKKLDLSTLGELVSFATQMGLLQAD